MEKGLCRKGERGGGEDSEAGGSGGSSGEAAGGVWGGGLRRESQWGVRSWVRVRCSVTTS